MGAVSDDAATEKVIKDSLEKIPQTYEGLKPLFDPYSSVKLTDELLLKIYPYLTKEGKIAWIQLQKEYSKPSKSPNKPSQTITYIAIAAGVVGLFLILRKKK